jgi:hypothetical protein
MVQHDERYEVRNADIERALRTIGVLIDGEVPEGWGWGLFLVPFGDNEAEPKGKGAVFWISNSERQGMIDAIKGWIDLRSKKR